MTITPKKVIALLCILFILAAPFIFPVKDTLVQVMESLAQFGIMGLVIGALLYIPACVLFLPGSLVTLGIGSLAAILFPGKLLLAILAGTLTVSLGSVSGASAAFLLGRTLARDAITRKLENNPRFKALDRAIEQRGLKMVFLLRLSPIFPFNFLNYALGLTPIRFRDYLLASWIGMLPATILYVYLGTGITSLANTAAGMDTPASPWVTALKIIGFIATATLVIYISRTAKKVLDEIVPEG